jgi:hypothetical protein
MLLFFFLTLLTFVIIGHAYLCKFFFVSIIKYKNNFLYNSDFIYGIFLLSLFVGVFHLFLPVKYISPIIFIIGICFFLIGYIKKKIKINLFSYLSILFFLSFISLRNELVYDSQLYHLQVIKMYSDYKVIFGIANLEERYGMSSTWHLLLSLFNYEIYNIKIVNFFNCIIYSFIINELFSKKYKITSPSNIFLTISILIVFLYSLVHPFGNGTVFNNLGSPEVDIIIAFFYIYSFYLFLKFFETNCNNVFQKLLIISFLSFTIKLSGVILICLPLIIFAIKKDFFIYIKTLIYILILLMQSFFHHFISSGCFIFPLVQTCVDTLWSMQIKDVLQYKKIITSFARDTPLREKFGDFAYTIDSFDWFLPWFKNYFLITEFLYLSTIYIILLLLFILLKFFYKKIFFNRISVYISLFIFLSLIIWFQAPEVRFVYGPIITLSSWLTVVVIHNFTNLNKKLYILKYFTLLIFSLIIIKNLENYDNLFSNPKKKIENKNFTLLYNLKNINIYKPSEGKFCLDLEYFCTYKDIKNYIIVDNKKYLFFLKKS